MIQTVAMNSKRAAFIGLLLALPGAVLLALLMLKIEPNFGPLAFMLRTPVDRPNVIGSAIAFTLTVLLPMVAFIVNAAPIAQSIRAGAGWLGHPANLAVALASLLVITVLAGNIIVDQYPCWVGVPNCD